MTRKSHLVVGAGLAGSAMATYLANDHVPVDLYERRQDPRRVTVDEGRSINLALATRGIVTLQELQIFDTVKPLLVPMSGRMVHDQDGTENFQPYSHKYGTKDFDINSVTDNIFSVSRAGLNAALLDAAEATGQVKTKFGMRLEAVDFNSSIANFTGAAGPIEVNFQTIYGCDGSNSTVRREMLRNEPALASTYSELEHGYKEIELPAGPDSRHQLDPNALHIWPRSEFMLIALPNPGGDFTGTLFMPLTGSENSFEALAESQNSPDDLVERFFGRHFPDFADLVPDLTQQFEANPTGNLGTVRTDGWSLNDRAVLVGDSAHAIVPFHGQGMNLALESARLLNERLESLRVQLATRADSGNDIAQTFVDFERCRKPGANAIADMALENYQEMRADVANKRYLQRRQLTLELQRLFPDKMVSRYAMVMFTTIPYEAAYLRHLEQQQIIDQLLGDSAETKPIDTGRAGRLLDELGPLPKWA